MFFDLDEITSEQIALDCADELVKEAIQSAGATRRKRQKIRSCQAKIKMLCLGVVLKDGSPLFLR